MLNNCFILQDLFIILVMLVYIVFGLFSYYYTLSTKRSEVDWKSGPAGFILYWHGIIFVLVFICISALLLFYSILTT